MLSVGERVDWGRPFLFRSVELPAFPGITFAETGSDATRHPTPISPLTAIPSHHLGRSSICCGVPSFRLYRSETGLRLSKRKLARRLCVCLPAPSATRCLRRYVRPTSRLIWMTGRTHRDCDHRSKLRSMRAYRVPTSKRPTVIMSRYFSEAFKATLRPTANRHKAVICACINRFD
jgi:hypothetical protein